MSRQKILPVIDIRGGKVVHGVAGKRAAYRPVVSRLAASADPSRVAKALCERVGVTDLYIADLDAIAGSDPDWDSYQEIGQFVDSLWIDAGVGSAVMADSILTHGGPGCRCIIALETLPKLRTLECIAAQVGFADSRRLVFSLDLRDSVPVTRDPAIARMSCEEIVGFAVSLGINSIIVLDVAEVGRSQGGATRELCQTLRTRHPEIQIVSGGGVRDLGDVARFADAGCDRVLVATALHNGRI